MRRANALRVVLLRRAVGKALAVHVDAAELAAYEEYKALLQPLGLPKQPTTMLSGTLAGITAVSATYPLDLVRATMAKPTSTHRSLVGAIHTIARERGIGAQSTGISATLLGLTAFFLKGG